MPHLRFIYDSSMSEGVRMSALVDQAMASDKGKGTEGEQVDDDKSEQDN
jgi:ribosome-binding factor A